VGNFNKQKAFGQHFLTDKKVIDAIVGHAKGALERNRGSALLEIGPGEGAITRPLIEALNVDQPFYIAERDRELIAYWKPETRFAAILEGDFLDQTDEKLKAIGPMVIASNLPYSAGTAIVIRLCKMTDQISEMVLMFQAEVAKRIYSPASTPDRGSLSLFIQNDWEVERLLVVKPDAFKPPPKVMSEVISLKRRTEPKIKLDSEQKHIAWNDLLKTAFKHRRKMLRGNFSGSAWQAAFVASGVDPTKRAESLEWEDWIQIWKKRFVS